MNLIYVPAEESGIELLFRPSKDLIDRYENISQIDYFKVLSWVRNKIEKNISEYTCISRDSQKVGYIKGWTFESRRLSEIHDISWRENRAYP
jgi:hypothetical protein